MQKTTAERNDQYAMHLSSMVRCKTVSFLDASKMDFAEFDQFRALLEKTYPHVHSALKKTLINGHALLYHWKGTGPGQGGKAPVLLTAHQDVVPADASLWRHDPFAGDIADGFVWGRGAMDCKCLILGHMEAIEALLEQGFMPDRDIYLAYGFDEEVMGWNGAQRIAGYLQSQGLHFDLVLDEGGMYARGEPLGLPGKMIARIGIFEKGYVDIQLTVTDEGGHASRPKEQTALGVLCLAIDAVVKHPFGASVSGALAQMYGALLPHLPDGALRTSVERLEADAEPLIRVLESSPAGNAMVRTTAAATMASASVAPNVLPQRAEAVFNLRIAEKDSIAGVLEHFKRAIADERVQISAQNGLEPSRTSSTACEAYEILKATIAESQPDAIAVPFPVTSSTDARMYECVAENIYRFGPFIGHMDLRPCVHGTDERTPVSALNEGVDFYVRLIRRLSGAGDRTSA